MLQTACTKPQAPGATILPFAGPRASTALSTAPFGAQPAARVPAARPSPERIMPRERLRTHGPGALSDIELLAVLVGSGLPGHGVFEIASALLHHFGSLRVMLGAQPEAFDGLRGIGRAKAAKLAAVLELARRALAEQLDDQPLVDTPGAVEDYLRLQIGTRPQEVFVCLYLDVRHRLIRSEESSRGSLTRMVVYPREIVRRALMLNAASLIVAHNHPSGAVQPSASDRRLTRVLRETLALVEVQMLDHLVIGTRDTYSFARNDWN